MNFYQEHLKSQLIKITNKKDSFRTSSIYILEKVNIDLMQKLHIRINIEKFEAIY